MGVQPFRKIFAEALRTSRQFNVTYIIITYEDINFYSETTR